jgi:hypothetical protein
MQWETVSSWNPEHVAQDDIMIDGEIARMIAKSMQDANISVTPKYYAKAISHYIFDTKP